MILMHMYDPLLSSVSALALIADVTLGRLPFPNIEDLVKIQDLQTQPLCNFKEHH